MGMTVNCPLSRALAFVRLVAPIGRDQHDSVHTLHVGIISPDAPQVLRRLSSEFARRELAARLRVQGDTSDTIRASRHHHDVGVKLARYAPPTRATQGSRSVGERTWVMEFQLPTLTSPSTRESF